MKAIDPELEEKTVDEFALVDALSKASGTPEPKAVSELWTAPVRHKTTCAVPDMEKTIKTWLGI